MTTVPAAILIAVIVFIAVVAVLHFGLLFLERRNKEKWAYPHSYIFLPFMNISPIWLLAYRVVAFAFNVIVLIIAMIVAREGVHMWKYFTVWSHALLTLYFGVCFS